MISIANFINFGLFGKSQVQRVEYTPILSEKKQNMWPDPLIGELI